jgi:hypothetical protein
MNRRGESPVDLRDSFQVYHEANFSFNCMSAMLKDEELRVRYESFRDVVSIYTPSRKFFAADDPLLGWAPA